MRFRSHYNSFFIGIDISRWGTDWMASIGLGFWSVEW